MGRKKQQQNDFYFFMVEKKPQIEKKLGRVVTMAELPQHVSSEWKAMPESQKQKYKSMKERSKEKAEKLDCRGLPMTVIDSLAQLNLKKEEDMEREIINTVDMYDSGSILHEATFYIISTSFYVHTEERNYYPAELGLVQFSFRSGIIKEYHVIFKPVIPRTYAFTAKLHSNTTHNLLEQNYGVEDKEEVLLGLREFVNEENNKLPPLYTLEEEMEQTAAILDGITGVGHYRVYSLDKLFMHLYSRVYSSRIPQSIANEMITHCGLDYHPAVACEWHITYQKDAGKYCSLSCARRWVFMMCDNMNLVKTFGVVPEEGKHLPRAVQSYGVLVDVPRTACKDNLDETETSNASNSWHPVPEDDDNSGFFTGTRRREVASSPSHRPTESAWGKHGATAGSINNTRASSYTASSAASLASQNRDVESEEFSSLPAGITLRGAGIGRSAVIGRDAVAGRGADFGRGAGVGRGLGSAESVSNSPLVSFGGIGRGMKPEDILCNQVAGIGRGQKSRQPKPTSRKHF